MGITLEAFWSFCFVPFHCEIYFIHILFQLSFQRKLFCSKELFGRKSINYSTIHHTRSSFIGDFSFMLNSQFSCSYVINNLKAHSITKLKQKNFKFLEKIQKYINQIFNLTLNLFLKLFSLFFLIKKFKIFVDFFVDLTFFPFFQFFSLNCTFFFDWIFNQF